MSLSLESDSTASSPMIWFLRSSRLFSDFTDSLLIWAEQEAREIEFKRNEVISLSERGHPYIFVILEGQVKLRSLTENGKETIIDVAGQDDVFGPVERLFARPEGPLKSPDGYATEAVGLSNGAAIRFRVEEFRRMIDQRPLVSLSVSRLLGLKSTQFQLRISRLLYRSSLGKVAGLLLELGERYGEEDANGQTRITFQLTQQELASMVGVKRETVSECLALLEDNELITYKGKRIVINDPGGLSEVA